MTTTTERAWRLDTVVPLPVSSEIEKPAEPAPAATSGSSARAHVERAKSAGFVRQWNQVLHAWARARLKRLGVQRVRFESILHDLIAIIETADKPVLVEKALLRQAQRLVPAYRVELSTAQASLGDDDDFSRCARGSSTGGEGSPLRAVDRNAQSILELPIRCESVVLGRLRIRPRTHGVGEIGKETIRRIKMLCTVGACAIQRLSLQLQWPEDEASADRADPRECNIIDGTSSMGAPFVNSKRLHDATFLNAVLPFAFKQARRHNEPLSLICVAIDRLGGVQELLGQTTVDALVERVGETVASMIRASDIVARLDDDRIVAVLPRAPGGGALFVAQKICRSIADKSPDDLELPHVTVSIGVAAFPSCADDVFSLFDAADLALARAQSQGRNQALLAPRRSAPAAVHVSADRETLAAP